MKTVECPGCSGEYEKLGTHWTYNPDHRPELSGRQHEIVVGSMMGDGNLDRTNKNPRLRVRMITPRYLRYVDGIFGCLGTGVSLRVTAAESASKDRESGFRPGAEEENYSDVYAWYSRSHPELHDHNWYTGPGGEKVWPDDIELTPTVLKHWYCGDGNWYNSGSNNCIRIAMNNERENTKKVTKYFERAGIPSPSNYNGSGGRCNAHFTVDESRDLFEYMGSPPPGFEYKWPDEYHERRKVGQAELMDYV